MAPRLTSLPSRLTSMPSRIGQAPQQARQTRDTVPWRHWYKTSRWQKLRQVILLRDAYTCRSCKRVCGGKYPADDSPVIDHIQAHRGDERLFWLESNLQVLCKAPCHDSHKQKQEQASRYQVGDWS